MTQYSKIDKDVFTRCPSNPVLSAADFQDQLGIKMRAVYNSSAAKTPDGKYVMLCRVNQLNHITLLWGADSEDGINWTLRPEPFQMPEDDTWKRMTKSVYFDPRITYIDGEYLVLLATQGGFGSRVALFRSKDLQTLEFINYICVPINRNMVIFPEKNADGLYMRLERPAQDAGGKGDIWLSYSPDLVYWGDSKEVLHTGDLWNFGISGIGPSTVPYRTDEGWLIIYHAIMNNCTSREYSVGAALLDLEDPSKLVAYAKHPLLYPEADYEMVGLVDHVCFPCAKIIEPDGELKLYYGGADTVQCMATAQLDDVIHACKHW